MIADKMKNMAAAVHPHSSTPASAAANTPKIRLLSLMASPALLFILIIPF